MPIGKNYIWLNPVVLQMTEAEERENSLQKLSFEEVHCRENHIETVRKIYREAAALEKRREQQGASHQLLCDVRCPMAVDLVKTQFPQAKVIYPKTLPILVQSAAELSKRTAAEPEAQLTVITPCEALCVLGRLQGYPRTVFMTWKAFCRRYDLHPRMKRQEQSPIPVGFFAGCAERVVSLDSRESILHFFTEQREAEADIVEMLYCSGGCHHGEGMLGTEAVWS